MRLRFLVRASVLVFVLLWVAALTTSCGKSEETAQLEKRATELEKKVADLQKQLEEAKSAAPSAAGKTLETVRKRGYLLAGVNGDVYGFSMPDEKGVWKGLDVDTAKAIAAAVFGDAEKVKFVALTAVQRLPALQSKEIDVLCRNTTQTLTRETTNGLNFCHVNFYDGQGFLVNKKTGIKSAKELDGATVCVLPGTTTEMNAADFFRKNGFKWKPVVIEQASELNKAFFAGRCDVLTSDSSQLAAHRSVAPNPDDYVLLPEIISKEPLAPVVRHGDDQWYDIVNWTVMALIEAEELGITSKNVDEKLKSKDPKVMRFLGVTPGMGKALGLDDKWAYNIIKQVGNYGEIFERNVGVNTKLGLKRGLNALWTEGGLMYAAPFR
ncbi:MAG: amino acid ABC transporter substrate-binding protein [Deltaproteobacteria bacterium]|nr:amino acid ABC transporter substrate-binding protein [Deltaproteobacteria bacterium]MBW2016040.1 amino acid ABC transporter substrate-binding protein [Deltaproteobacteria bacterium]MBW2128337.1 amino acid ABC transporter substrate-binding protein [Deltaproteobacteria bacterium]MBW2302149.1 amino acid ABC transporter substrate-binding protein [Deltaproteobacteria bacterium]